VLSAIKKSNVTLKVAVNCLDYAIIIAMARVNGDTKYESYRNGYGLKKPVADLLKYSGFDISNGGGFEEFGRFQDHISDYQIIVFDGLETDRLMFRGNSRSANKLRLLYDRENEHYNVITNLKDAIYVTGVIHYTTLSSNVTTFAPCVLLHHLVPRITQSIVVHAIDGFSVSPRLARGT